MSQLLEDVKSALQTGNRDDIVKSLKAVGDLARTEEGRSELKAQDGVVESFRPFLADQSPFDDEITQWTARAVGNLCYEDSALSTQFSEINAVNRFISLLNSQHEVARRNAAGALNNLASDNEGVSSNIVKLGGLPLFVRLLSCTDELTVNLTSKAIINVLRNGDHLEDLKSAGGFEAFSRLSRGNYHGEYLNLINIIVDNGVVDAQRIKLLNQDMVDALLYTVREAADEEEDDAEERSTAWETINTLSEKDDGKPLFTTLNIYNDLFSIVERESERKEEAKKAYRALSNASLEELNIQKFVEKYDLLIQQADHPEIEISMGSLMVLGNLARSEEQCIKMADDETLLSKLTATTSHSDVRISHLSLGVYRNLAVPVQNKEKLVTHGIYDVVKPHLSKTESPNLHLQYVCVGIVKALISGGESFLASFAQAGGLKPLISTANGIGVKPEEDDDGNPKEKDPRVEYEAARVLVRYTDTGDVIRE
ncbi:hypothetical protein PROFUN_00937 [Planoprotostelium fungivorum]|uniref:Uncharacterized protein n=1 Tax=Planoprotostelium fungivorum TaxID=1890364 RepID=A0A2P6N481_9EUKA|nr:hypothetical protein PROFUN_00937 [Planoprotostelium fungivorum]